MKPNYYAIIPANVRYDKELTPNAKLLYGEITALCNQEGYCWATNSYFANLYGVTTVSVSKWISQLESKGYLYTTLLYKEKSKEIKERRIYITPPIKEKFNTPIKEKFNTPKTKVNEGIKEKFKENNTSSNTTNNIYVGKYESDENLKEIVSLFENNIGMINGLIAEQLIDLSKDIESNLFKEAIKIASDKNKCNFGYVKGICNNWIANNIKTLKDLEAYRVSQKNKKKEIKEKEKQEVEEQEEHNPMNDFLKEFQKKMDEKGADI